MSATLTIDPEFQSLITALSETELELLKQQILAQGCLQPLCVWKTEDDQRILLDGHNRYRICTENQKKYQTVNVKLESREHAKLWILEHQAGRRNLTDDQRAVVWNEIREQRPKVASYEGAAKARAAKAAASSDLAKSTKSAVEPASAPVVRNTRKEVATESKIPESKFRKLAGLKKTNPTLYEKIRTGEITLRQTRTPKPKSSQKSLRDRYSEKDFFARIGRMLAGTLVKHPLLDELLQIKKQDWTPEAEQGFRCLIKNLDEISERAHTYASGLNKLLRAYGKAKAA